jgi:hypothetical protein
VGACVLGTLGALTDAVAIGISDAPKAAALASAIAAGILGVALAILISPAVALLGAVCSALSRAGRLSWIWPLPLAVVALGVAGHLTEMTSAIGDVPRRQFSYEVIVVGFSIAIVVLGALFRRGTRIARAGALAIAIVACALDVLTARAYYRDAHDVVAMIAAAGLVVVARPLRARLAALPPKTLWKVVLLVLLASMCGSLAVNPLQTGWRSYATRFGYYEPRFARTFRLLVDFDRDGFSPIAWGGDCDDFDATRNPRARETVPGLDRNCNGVALPKDPSDDDRGLSPPAGDPNLPAGGIDRFVLITIDCLRADAFRPDVMPRLTALASRGLVLRRLYAAGSRTQLSLPLIQRGSDKGTPAAARLGRHAITSAAVIGFYEADKQFDFPAGFGHARAPTQDEGRWPAPRVTDLALLALTSMRTPGFLWAHYFDAHDPYQPIPSHVEVPALDFPNLDYLRHVAFIDREIGRLLDTLEREGMLERTAILVTSDHGEGLGFRGVETHGTSTYEPLIHVPGILVAPGLSPGTFDGLASHRDIPATVVGAFGRVGDEPGIEDFGRSWFRLRAARAELHRFVVSRSSSEFTLHGFLSPQAAIVEGPLKLGKTFEDGLVEMVDLAVDPHETRNLEPSRRADAARLERDLEVFRDIDGYP